MDFEFDDELSLDRFFVDDVIRNYWAHPNPFAVASSHGGGEECSVVPEMQQPNESLAYDEPLEKDLVLYDLDNCRVQPLEECVPFDHAQEVAEHRVPTFEMPFAPPFEPADHFDFVPADPQPSTSKAAIGGPSGTAAKSSKPETKKSRPRVARKRGVRQQNTDDHRDGKRLYVFTHRLLSDPNFEHVVRWLDPLNGVWQVVNSKEYARLWGVHKNNPDMTYPILGRALRYLKAWKILEKHGRRKLVFQFTPTYRCLTPLQP
ncbi:ETS domain-containing protein [Aphelenchoides fujianensis]|nr:ETS domain-containing protein [Aphelenchoides fujianensis]